MKKVLEGKEKAIVEALDARYITRNAETKDEELVWFWNSRPSKRGNAMRYIEGRGGTWRYFGDGCLGAVSTGETGLFNWVRTTWIVDVAKETEMEED